MSLRGFTAQVKISSPRGSWQAVANRRGGSPSRASLFQNMRVRFGTVRSRAGTSAVFQTVGKVTGMFNWVTPSGRNLVLYQDGNAIKSYDQALAASATLITPVTCRAPSFAPLDVWTYFCGFDTAGNGTFQTEIFAGYDGAGNPQTDKAFRAAPAITGWTAVDSGPGYCTQGQHFIGFVYQNRTGYQGVPVTGVSYAITATNNGSPDVVTAPGNNLLTDAQLMAAGQVQQVTIAGATGDYAINGTRNALMVASPTFQLTDTAGNQINGNGAYISGGIVTNPIQFTTTAGLRQITITVDLPAQPDGGTSPNGGVQAKLFLIATRADNPALWYFIPSDSQTGQIGENDVPLNQAVTLTYVFSLSDEDIANSLAGDTAQANFLFLTQNPDGTGPPLNPALPLAGPNFVVAYGQRMCYGAGTTLYVSDINAPQQIAADTNSIRMQNQRKIGYAFQLPGNPSLYLTGDRWTGYVTDNSDSPSTWGEPIGTSDALGAPFPDLVCSATGGNYVWIVTASGVYYFDGQYSANQLLYLITGYDEQQNPTGWNRVNWNAAYAIQIRDDVANLKLYVAVPLDGATECNHTFLIDYRMGKTFETVDIGIDQFTPLLFSSIAVVKEYATGRSDLWIGPEATGSVAHLDSTTHNDLGSAIQCIWQSGLVRGSEITTSMLRAGYMDIWARGNAPLAADGSNTFGIAIISLDGQTVLTPDLQSQMGVPSGLVEQPGIYYSVKFDLNKTPNLTVAFQTNSVDAWFELSSVQVYLKPDLSNR